MQAGRLVYLRANSAVVPAFLPALFTGAGTVQAEAPIERHTHERAEKTVAVLERPLSAPGRVRFPPIPGGWPSNKRNRGGAALETADPVSNLVRASVAGTWKGAAPLTALDEMHDKTKRADPRCETRNHAW